MPNLWETPGGACDDEDQTILYAVARELWEETGLMAESIGPPVGNGYIFHTRSGKTVRKLNFIVEVESGQDATLGVRLRPEEHQNLVWATEQDIKSRKANDIHFEFTTPDQEAVVLEAFNVLKATQA